MQSLAAIVLLGILSIASPTLAQARTHHKSHATIAHNQAKAQQKAMKKAAKAQQKDLKRTRKRQSW